jgi:hypothetical protein
MPADTDFAARAVSSAKERSQHMLDTAQQRSRQIADSAQRYMQENPVRAVSYTSAALFGLGIIIGRLLAPDRYDAPEIASTARRASQDWTSGAPRWPGCARWSERSSRHGWCRSRARSG